MATLTFTTTFNIAPTLPLLVIVDTTNYSGQSISTANVNGCLQVISPSGSTIYQNTDYSDNGCDIKISTSTTNKIPILLPFTGLKLVEQGDYTIIYTVKDITSTPVYYTQTNIYDNEYASPAVCIAQNVNVISQLWSQTDKTNYVVNGVTPTLARTNTLIYPTGIRGGAPANIVVTTATLVTTIFFNGTQTSTISSVLTYTYPDGLIVTDTVFGSKEFLVDGSFYCSIARGFRDYVRKMSNYKCSDITAFEAHEDDLLLLVSYKTTIDMMIDCGNDEDTISDFLLKINDIIGDCNCGCDDDKFSRITGWGTILGLNGTDGDDGSSAYQIAVLNGFVGTQAQWLASLVGATGANGTPLIDNNITVDSVHTGAYATLKSYLLPINTLTNNGDALEINASIVANGILAMKLVKILMGGADAMPSLSANGYLYMLKDMIYQDILMTVTRITATTVFISYKAVCSFGVPSFTSLSRNFYEATITVNDLGVSTNLIDIQGLTENPDSVVCKQLMVTYLKKQ